MPYVIEHANQGLWKPASEDPDDSGVYVQWF